MNFIHALHARWQHHHTLLCVGLDPDPQRLPTLDGDLRQQLFTFCRDIIDATADAVCAFKPQIAAFAALGAEDELERLIAHIHHQHEGIPVILDAKRGDIGNTARWYAQEAFERYCADAVTLNPYMGADTLEPWLQYHDKGLFILCRTSNPGAADLQDLTLQSGQKLYQHIAQLAAEQWNEHGNCGLVAGATCAHALTEIRRITGNMPLLVPGIGAQGGTLDEVLSAALTNNADGLIINASRSILYADNSKHYANAAHDAAHKLHQQMTAAIKQQQGSKSQ